MITTLFGLAVSAGVLVLFIIIPAVLFFALQIWLCFKVGKLILKLIPAVFAAVLLALVFLCSGTGFLSFLIGGFVGFMLLFTAFAVIIASLLGWGVYALIKKLR